MTSLVNMAAARKRGVAFGGFPSFLNILVILSSLCSAFSLVRAETRSAVINEQSGQLSVVDGYREDFVAVAKFSDEIKTTG